MSLVVYAGLIAAGVVVSFLMVLATYRVGRFVTHLECVQLRITNRELMQMQAESKRQLEAIDDNLSRIVNDPRTYEGMRIDLERVRELVKRRQT